MSRDRRRLSDRMLYLTRWYSTASPPCRKLTPAEKAATLLLLGSKVAQYPYLTTHGPSRRDEARP